MKRTLCVIGTGYVGLPLAMAFSKHYPTSAYSHSAAHIESLKKGNDRTGSFNSDELQNANIAFTSDLDEISDANIYIITVPTPVDKANDPDLTAITSATKDVAGLLNKGDIVIYESTVFIGCTQELCAPLLEEGSGLKYNEEFFCGFSPERINPSDREHTIENVVKIVAGSTPETGKVMQKLYSSIVKAGIHVAPAIEVAEASKLVENIQRDVNIALMNELSHLFNSLNIDTKEVIKAASTKWNFNTYYPGLVGGHCISVDPYYLISNAKKEGIQTSLIETSREINNQMPHYIVHKSMALMKEKGIDIKGASILLLGLSFKEDCPDIRNSQSATIALSLEKEVSKVDVYDPVVDAEEVLRSYHIECLESLPSHEALLYDAVIISVAHQAFKSLNIKKLLKKDSVVFDVKGILSTDESDARL